MALAVSRLAAFRRCAPRRHCAARCASQRAAPAQQPPPSDNSARLAPLSGPEVQRRVRAAWTGENSGDLRRAVQLLPRDAAALVDAELKKCVPAARALAGGVMSCAALAKATQRHAHVALTERRRLQVRRAAQSELALAAGAADAAADAHAGVVQGGGGCGA